MKIKSCQRRELIKLNEKKMILSGDLQPHEAEKLLPGFLHDKNMSADASEMRASVTELEKSLAPTPTEQRTDTSEASSSGPVQSKFLAAKERFQREAEEKAQKLREKAEQTEKEREKKQKDRQREKAEKLAANQQYKESIRGKAVAFLHGLQRDVKRCQDAIDETAKCGMKPGFAREWKASLERTLGKLEEDHTNVTSLSEGKSTDADMLDKAKATGLAFKTELANFRTAKNFGKKLQEAA